MSSENIVLNLKNRKLSGTIKLTGSKSESNRALIMQALSNGKVRLENMSEATDTVTLQHVLNSRIATLDVGAAGTAMRFLTAFYTLQPTHVLLTGSERMKQRPIGILVDGLRQLGAHIEYTEHEGYPPLKIRGSLQQTSNKVTIRGDVSSQYISALLLIAPNLPLGMGLHITGEITSKPYIEMTLALLEQAGITYTWEGQTIHIDHQPFNECAIFVEPDWSAASYWYALATLADEAEIFLPGLNGYSSQGDSKIAEIMANFGITSRFKDGGVFLKKEPKILERKIFDFKECPDLAQTVIVCCAALGHNATFTGLETLKIKETDRIQALQNELPKFGVKLIEHNKIYKLDCRSLHFPDKIYINTYQDHRMAMAFAPLIFKVKKVEIADSGVVGKSYPHFWDDLMRITSLTQPCPAEGAL